MEPVSIFNFEQPDHMYLLLVEDDLDLGNVLKHFLLMHCIRVDHISSGKEIDLLLVKNQYDLVILDVFLPDMDGFELAGKLRKKYGSLPFLFLTARALNDDKIKGLKLGAEDYITKPFDPEELLLRIKNILKRNNDQCLQRMQIRGFTFEKDNLLLYSSTDSFNLTPKEATLLFYLAGNANRLLQKKEILSDLWGSDDYFLGRSLDVFISRLRKYFASDAGIVIENVRGVGFRFTIKK